MWHRVKPTQCSPFRIADRGRQRFKPIEIPFAVGRGISADVFALPVAAETVLALLRRRRIFLLPLAGSEASRCFLAEDASRGSPDQRGVSRPTESVPTNGECPDLREVFRREPGVPGRQLFFNCNRRKGKKNDP